MNTHSIFQVLASASTLITILLTQMSVSRTEASTPWPVTESWSLSSAPPGDWVAVSCSADGTFLAAATRTLREPIHEAAIFVSLDGGATWERSDAPNVPWTSLATSSNGRLLAATVGYGEGIYSSSDFGRTWQKTSAPNADWVSIAMSADGSKLLAAGLFSDDPGQMPAGGLYLSSDAGAHWMKASAPNELWQRVASSSDGSRLVAADDSSSIYLSSDAGLTWTRNDAPEESWTSLACSADGKRIVAGSERTIFVSSDYGVSWRQSDLPESWLWSAACSADGMILLAASGDSGFHRSTDGGNTWIQETDLGGLWPVLAVSADGVRAVAGGRGYFRWGATYGDVYVRGVTLPLAIREQPESRVIVRGGEAAFTIEATGTTATYQWQRNGTNLLDETGKITGASTPNLTIESVSLDDVGDYSVVISNSISSLRSSQASLKLATWTLAKNLDGTAFSMAASADGTRFVAAVRPLSGPHYSSQLWTSSDGGRDWRLTTAPETNWQSVASSSDGLKLVAVARDINGGPGPIYASPDGGSTWHLSGAPNGDWKDVASSADGRRLVAVAESGAIFTSTDSGASWRQMPDPTSGIGIPNVWQSVASSADGMRLAVAQRGIFVSSDGGETWKQGNAPLAYWNSIACSADGMKLIAAAWWEPLHLSSDGGITWTPAPAPEQMWGQVACSADGNQFIALPDSGWISWGGGMPPDRAPAYLSSDFGFTWTVAQTPSEYWRSAAMSANGSVIAAGPASGGILLSPQPAILVELKITRSNAGIVLSWPPGEGMVLQHSADLGSRQWSVVEDGADIESSNTITLSSSAPNRFFRLYAK